MAVAKEESSFEPKPFGRYVLLDKLAVGGMAEIYKAKTYGIDGFEKLLAVKRILPHFAADKEFINMLVDEAKLTVLLSHANIVQVFDLGKVGDDYFISMEYINGTNLREVMRRIEQRTEKMPEEIAVYIMSEMCKGLDYAHRKTDSQGSPLNIVHRDISPQNILISYEGEVKIVDFGIAKAAMNVSHTMAGILKGKIAYMSPEQALGKPLDHRTDSFSAGIVLYEMLTGEKLFSGETQFEVLNQIRTTRVNTSLLPNTIPPPLKTILVKALAYNPKDRYQNAGDFQLELTKYLYSSYLDFSPRQLSALLGRLFNREMKHREATPPPIDEKTRSMILNQAAKEDIVVHGATPLPSTVATQQTSVSGIYAVASKKKWVRIAAGLLLAIVVGVGGYWGYKKISEPSVSKPEPADSRPSLRAETGTFRINSSPSDAQILLNGAETGLKTPARLENLALGQEYEIKLVKEKYQSTTKTYALTTTEPIFVDEKLKPLPMGIIEVSSSPVGARIVVEGRETGLTTPARIENLQVPKEYQIRLTLAGHADWQGGVEVKDLDPVKLAASLTPLPSPAPVASQPTPAPTETRPPTYGRLEIDSTPQGATISLDGKSSGRRTPAHFEKLPPGKKVTVSLSQEGYEVWRQQASIRQNETTRLTASLKKRPAAAPEPPRPEPISEPASGGGTASLKIDSEPSGADVYINSEFKGLTPVLVKDSPAGNIKLLLSKDGYLKYNSTLALKPGEDRNLGSITLQGLYGELNLNSTPPRAAIYFDGQLIAPKTPVTIRKVPRDRTHTVRLELDGYRPWETTFEMKENEMKRYDVILEKD